MKSLGLDKLWLSKLGELATTWTLTHISLHGSHVPSLIPVLQTRRYLLNRFTSCKKDLHTLFLL